jgi:hypothetical protein
MSQNHSIYRLSVTATAAIVALTFIDFSGATATAAGNTAGVACTDGAVGDLVPTDRLGSAVVTAGAAITAGQRLEVGATGYAVPHNAGVIVAVALEAASAAGQTIEVDLIPN